MGYHSSENERKIKMNIRFVRIMEQTRDFSTDLLLYKSDKFRKNIRYLI